MEKKPVIKKLSKLTILTASVSIITIAIGWIFIYMPFANSNKSLRSEILYERDKNVLIGKIRAIDKHLKIYMKRVPKKERGVSWLISEVSEMASREDIEMTSITPSMPQEIENYTKFYVVIDIVCTYFQLGTFISYVESSEKFMKIEEVYIKRLDMDKGFNKESSKYDSFDLNGHLVISMLTIKE